MQRLTARHEQAVAVVQRAERARTQAAAAQDRNTAPAEAIE
jgi:hypothetical protein